MIHIKLNEKFILCVTWHRWELWVDVFKLDPGRFRLLDIPNRNTNFVLRGSPCGCRIKIKRAIWSLARTIIEMRLKIVYLLLTKAPSRIAQRESTVLKLVSMAYSWSTFLNNFWKIFNIPIKSIWSLSIFISNMHRWSYFTRTFILQPLIGTTSDLVTLYAELMVISEIFIQIINDMAHLDSIALTPRHIIIICQLEVIYLCGSIGNRNDLWACHDWLK